MLFNLFRRKSKPKPKMAAATPGPYAPSYPHCDARVLHAPGDCIYCDHYPEAQQGRIARGENFTGKGPDVATDARPLEVINLWPGNRPVNAERQQQIHEESQHDFNILLADRIVPADQDVTVMCDRCKEMVDGWYGHDATSGFYLLAKTLDRTRPWASFFLPDEYVLCDACMWKDPRYQEVYGVRS